MFFAKTFPTKDKTEISGPDPGLIAPCPCQLDPLQNVSFAKPKVCIVKTHKCGVYV